MERQYRNHLSGYLHWDQLVHAEDWLLFEKNIGAYICIDEVALSRGELYTVLTNKEAHGGKGSMIAIIKGTDVHTVTSVLLKLSRRRRYQVREITLDMAPNMEQIARICFPAAKRVTDRFHVQKLAYEAVQEMRVKARWEALDEESTQIAYAKACGKMYHAPVFANGDTRKQLLARSIYLLYKKESLWTQSQRIRAEILFKEYPDIKKGYYLSMRLGLIYHQCKFKDIALTRLARWYDEVDKSGFLAFGRVARSRKKLVDDVNISVYRGEILGIAGLMGAGRTEFALSLFGMLKADEKSELWLNGQKVQIRSPEQAIRMGIGYVSEDRKQYGLILSHDVKRNMSLASLKRLTHLWTINQNLEITQAQQYVKDLNIKVRDVDQCTETLSGGNQQKVILAKWMLAKPEVLILDEPTRGVDVGAKYEIYQIMNELVSKGVAIIMISSELPEILGMSDRIYVMHEGTINGELTRENATQEKILYCASGERGEYVGSSAE